MAIPSTLRVLIDQLNQEFNQTEQEATNGLKLVRELLSRFPDNDILIQFFAYLNSALIFVDTYKGYEHYRPSAGFTMKQLPEEQELLELVEMARVAAEKARETSELATAIAFKWQQRLEHRRAVKQKTKTFLVLEEKSDRV